MISPNKDFSITIDFDKDSGNPARVFKSMASIIETFQTIDNELVNRIDNKIETVLLLEDVEKGSLKAFFANLLKNIPDTAIENLSFKKLVGSYLVKAKHIYIKNTERTLVFTDKKELDIIEMELKEAASEFGIDKIPTYVPTTKKSIIKNLDKINKSFDTLTDKDKVSFSSENGDATFNLKLNIDMEKMEDLITGDVYESETKMILKVKKPDYLGDSKWEFKHGNKTISAKISDMNWLRSFQDREIDVRPQDSLVCNVLTINKYDFEFELISVSHEIKEVIKINPRPSDNQTSLI